MTRYPDGSNNDSSQHLAGGSPARLAYGITDAAAALDLSRSRIYELIADGEIATCKIGKRTIIPAAELTAFLERHRVVRRSAKAAVSSAQGHLARTRDAR